MLSYFVGSFLTILITYIVVRFRSRDIAMPGKSGIKISYSQSAIHETIKHFIPKDFHKKQMITQTTKHAEKSSLRVIIMEDNAYWVVDNKFYVAPVRQDGVDKESATVVDTMGMDKVQLDKMLFIMDRLRDGKDDDNRSPGDY
jgi:hypothetical protein